MNNIKQPRIVKCRICNAVRGDTGDNRRFHTFPKNPEMRKQWLLAIKMPYPGGRSICSKHFKPEDYRNPLMYKLKPTACPERIESMVLPNLNISKFKDKIQKSLQEYIEHSCCFILGCESIYNREDSRSVSMFFPPVDDELFEKWKVAIPIREENLTRDKLICELHFQEQDIERFHITKLSNGYIDITEKDKPTLKSGAVPSIFINTSILSKSTLERLLPSHHNNARNVSDSDSISNSLSDNQIADDNSSDISVGIEYFSYPILLKNVSLIKKPNDWWAISSCVQYVICARWNNKYIPEKKVIIEEDLRVKVFLLEVELNITDHIEITCIDDISAVLQKVESYKICTIDDLIN